MLYRNYKCKNNSSRPRDFQSGNFILLLFFSYYWLKNYFTQRSNILHEVSLDIYETCPKMKLTSVVNKVTRFNVVWPLFHFFAEQNKCTQGCNFFADVFIWPLKSLTYQEFWPQCSNEVTGGQLLCYHLKTRVTRILLCRIWPHLTVFVYWGEAKFQTLCVKIPRRS